MNLRKLSTSLFRSFLYLRLTLLPYRALTCRQKRSGAASGAFLPRFGVWPLQFGDLCLEFLSNQLLRLRHSFFIFGLDGWDGCGGCKVLGSDSSLGLRQ